MSRYAALFSLIAALTLPTAPSASGVWQEPLLLGRLDGLSDIVLQNGTPVMKSDGGDYQVLQVPESDLALAPLPLGEQTLQPRPFDIIPHATIVGGERDIGAAWFASPTTRYGHGVLGDGIEAGALKIDTAAGKVLSYTLADMSVFEDLAPRLADLDGDGRDEVIVVRSYPEAGSAVALFGVREGRLIRLAESSPVGTANRWLNPVGAGDFDGDGRMEVAVVRTPHIGGTLILYRWEGDRLTEFARKEGFSSHAKGSTVLGMSAILDIDGDGSEEIVLPDQSRTRLQAVSYAGGEFRILWTTPASAEIATSIMASDVDGRRGMDILYGLADGSVLLLRR